MKSVQSINQCKSLIQIVKGHNGEMKVETQEGEGSKFIVIIPLT
jgi:signal transduction histidine kinase